MARLYKFTTQDNKTRSGRENECLWGENVTHSGTGKGDLCGPGYIHAYSDPRLAVIFNPIHANYKNPRLWICEGEIAIDRGDKLGCVRLTTLHEMPVPEISFEQKICFAILCVRETRFKNKIWDSWADKYLSGEDRDKKAASAASAAAASAASAAAASASAASAASADAYASAADAYAAYAAAAASAAAAYASAADAYAAYAAAAASAAAADAYAAYAYDAYDAYAAYAAYAYAAYDTINSNIDFVAIMDKAMKYE